MEEQLYSRILLNRDGKFPVVVQASIDVFLSSISVDEYYNYLLKSGQETEHLTALVLTFLNATPSDALWCNLLLQFEPPQEIASILNIIISTFSSAVQVPTGLRLKNEKYGNSHISKEIVRDTKEVSRIAMRILLLMIGNWFQNNNTNFNVDHQKTREVFMSLLKSQLSISDDSMTVVIAAKTIAHGIPVDIFAPGPEELLTQNLKFSQFFIMQLYLQLDNFLKNFFLQKRAIHSKQAELAGKKEDFDDYQFEYKGVLYDITKQDDEESLPVPLSNYLKDSEELKGAHTKMTKAGLDVLSLSEELYKLKSLVALIAPCCRLLFVLCSIMTHTLVFERELQFGKGEEEEEAARCFLHAFDWNRVLAFGIFERSVYNCIISRLFMTCAARCFQDLQVTFCRDGLLANPDDSDEEAAPIPCPIHLAFRDLCSNAISWYPKSGQQSPVQDDLSTMGIPTKLLNLDSRISTAFCYWGIKFNVPAQMNVLSWNGARGSYWKLLILKSENPAADDECVEAIESGSEKDSSIVAFFKDSPISSNFGTIFESSKICTDSKSCGHFAEYQAIIFADAFLSFSTFEGQCSLHRRGLHPLSIVSVLLAQSPCDIKDHLRMFLEKLLRIVRVECEKSECNDLLLLTALNFMASLIQGQSPPYRTPSKSPVFTHLRFETEFPTIIRIVRSILSDEDIVFLAGLCSDFIFAGHVNNLLPIGSDDFCAFGVALNLLLSLTLVDAQIVYDALKISSAACDFTWAVDTHKSSRNSDGDSDSLMLPFLLALEGGTTLMRYIVERRRLKLQESIIRRIGEMTSPMIMHLGLQFLTAISSKVNNMYLILVENSNYICKLAIEYLSMLEPGSREWPSLVTSQSYPSAALRPLNVILIAEQFLLLANCLIAGGKKSGNLPYISEQNVFLLGFILSGNGIIVAHEMAVYASIGLNELSKREPSGTPNEWESFLVEKFSDILRDVMIFALEFLFTCSIRRTEIQTLISDQCKDLLFWIPSHLIPPSSTRSKFRMFHVGIAELCCRLIAAICLRHSASQELVLQNLCVEGMMACLAACLPEKKLVGADKLASTIVSAIQILVMGNESAWQYVQDCSGIDGLLQICQLGNTVIKNLSCCTLMEACGDNNRANYADDVASKGVIGVLAPLLNPKEDETTILCCLRLIYTLSVQSPRFRSDSFSISGNIIFTAVLSLLHQNKSDSVKELICNVLSAFGADNPSLLRRVLQGKKESMQILVEISASPSDNSALTKAAIQSMACMTTSDDSEYPVGAPYFRQALHSAAFLPSLK